MGWISYGYFAVNDARYLYDCVRPFNATCLACHEVAEKFLKHVIDEMFQEDAETKELLDGHDLIGIVEFLHKTFSITVESLPSLTFLNAIYYTGRYPSENNHIATVDEINGCVDCVNAVIGWFFSSAPIDMLFDLYTEVTGLEDLRSRFGDDRYSRLMLMDLCGVKKIPYCKV